MIKYHPAALGLSADWGGAIRYGAPTQVSFFLSHFFLSQAILFIPHIRSSPSDFVTFWICHLGSYSGVRRSQVRQLDGHIVFHVFLSTSKSKGNSCQSWAKMIDFVSIVTWIPVILQSFSIDDFLHIFPIENMLFHKTISID